MSELTIQSKTNKKSGDIQTISLARSLMQDAFEGVTPSKAVASGAAVPYRPLKRWSITQPGYGSLSQRRSPVRREQRAL